MKTNVLLLLAVFILSATASAQDLRSIAVGTSLPQSNVKMKDVTGKSVSLAEVKKENGLLVMFSCNTCPFVVKNQQRTKEVAEHAMKNGFGVILINSNETARDGGDSFEEMKKYASAQGYTWPYVVDEDSKVANAFGANRTPEVYVFDKNDKLVYKGAIDDNPGDAAAVQRQHLKTALDAVVSGKEVSVKESRSVGCTIKRAS